MIEIEAIVEGPKGSAPLLLALDTGASVSVISQIRLRQLGYDLDTATTSFTTGTGQETAPRVMIDSLQALGHLEIRLSILAYTLPPNTFLDGVLGLDFLRYKRLIIDFRGAELWLELPRRRGIGKWALATGRSGLLSPRPPPHLPWGGGGGSVTS